jgi:hypothetical protein
MPEMARRLLHKLVEAVGRRREEVRLPRLGPDWHFVEWPQRVALDGFLAIGPGGVFAVCPLRQGRSRLLIAGDVVQINGERPPFVAGARSAARQVGKALSAAVGSAVPVTPVLHVAGTGVLNVNGLPKGVFVTTGKDLDRFLLAAGKRLSPDAASRLADVANRPATWRNPP